MRTLPGYLSNLRVVPLHVRSLCSLPSLVICTIVSQVAVLSSYNSMATVSLQIVCQVALLPFFTGNLHCCKSGCSVPFLQQWGHSQLALLTTCSNFIPIYPNLFEFIVNLFEFCRIFEWIWVKRKGMWKVELCVSAIIPTCNAAYILDKVFIQASGLACEVCVEVSSLRSLPTTVCATANSVVCQVAMLPSFNSLWG